MAGAKKRAEIPGENEGKIGKIIDIGRTKIDIYVEIRVFCGFFEYISEIIHFRLEIQIMGGYNIKSG
jgi:hypothetical protein